jgi:hypothetical protein
VNGCKDVRALWRELTLLISGADIKLSDLLRFRGQHLNQLSGLSAPPSRRSERPEEYETGSMAKNLLRINLKSALA